MNSVANRDSTVYSLYASKKEWRQVNERIKKGHIGIVEEVQETSLYTGMHNKAITVLHEQWMYLGSRDTPTSHCVTW